MQPLVFEPYFRPQIWGGRRLEQRLGKALPAEGTFGESWEISAHPHHRSRVAEGPFQGATLEELWERYAEDLAGRKVAAGTKFPLLIKFLDCHDLLSVQVHPDDRKARELLGEEHGKTEAWIVLDAEPAGRIYAGLKPGVTRADLERHLQTGTVDQCLHAFAPKPGDCVFLPAGTVHAVGGGVLIAEVQQSSDATLRLFDWNRVGSDGKPRPLHRDEALQSIDWSAGPVGPRPPSRLDGLGADVEGERLVACPYFQIDRYRFGSELPAPCPGDMTIWIVLDGSAELVAEKEAYCRRFVRGETVLVPAASGPSAWKVAAGPAALLAVTLPR